MLRPASCWPIEFHNDAVRDTLTLRERRLVRLFRLSGTARVLTYFEITERSQALHHADHPAAGRRTSARVVLLDPDRRGVAVVRV